MSEVTTDVIKNENVESVDVEVTPQTPEIVMPTSGMIKQSMINSAAGIVAGVIIHTAISGAVFIGKKAFVAAKDGISNCLEEKKEEKLLKALEEEAASEETKPDDSSEDED